MAFSHTSIQYAAARGYTEVNFPLTEGTPQTAYTIHLEISIQLS
jgi:hypothetical protein